MDTVKVKIKTARMICDMSGPLDSVIIEMVAYVSTSTRREKVIAAILEAHANMSAREAEKGGVA